MMRRLLDVHCTILCDILDNLEKWIKVMSYNNRVPKVEVLSNQQNVPQVVVQQKMPLFLIKLWNIVEDPAYQQIIQWDEVSLV
uniref:Ovule protein n=1 Tax=Heterorhabditis bacteriophora TaxID=37862 RepID=A0A1I7XHF1_HETBA